MKGNSIVSCKTIVILGGGIGGLVAANELRRKLPENHRIIVVERNSQHAFAPSFLWAMTGDRSPERITKPINLLVRSGVEFIFAEAHQIDPENQRIETSSDTLSYDMLIIALGAELSPEIIPGLKEGSHTFYSLEGTSKLRDALLTFRGGTVSVVVSSMPYKCPGAPYEGAMLIADVFDRRKMRDMVKIELVTPESQPMPVAGPELGKAVTQMLEAKGVDFFPFHKLAKVEPQTQELKFADKDPRKYDLLVAVPPHRSPAVVRESGLANEAGWIPVDQATMVTKQPNVFAIGDVTTVPIPGRWNPEIPMTLPKAGVFAHAQALVVAHRIVGEITGEPVSETFCGDGFCMLEAGGGFAGIAYGNFFSEPAPTVKLRRLGRLWHLGKVLFEKWWLMPYGIRRHALRFALSAAAKAIGMKTSF